MTSHRGLEAADTLRNMSASPRSTITLQPFRARAESGMEDGEPTNWGLSWVLRVDIGRMVLDAFPGWQPWNLLTIGCVPEPGLCGALALAQARQGTPADPWGLCKRNVEDLADELMRLAPNAIEVPGLPTLMMATRVSQDERPLETDPSRALAVLTHLSNGVCDLSASPMVAEALLAAIPMDFWAPRVEVARG